MSTVTVHQAKTQLSELLRRVEAGEEIVIARGDKPVAILRKYESAPLAERRRAGEGSLAGRAQLPADEVLIGPMDDAELAKTFGDEFVDLLGASGNKR